MKDETRRGLRGAGLGLIVLVLIYGELIVLSLGGWFPFAALSVLLAVAAVLVLRLTQTGQHRR